MIATNGTPELKNPDRLSDELRDFLGVCLQVDQRARPNATRLLMHSFLGFACPPSDLAPLLDNVSRPDV